MVSVTLDQRAHALYIKLDKKKIAKTLSITNDIFLDVDDSDTLIGIEVLFPKTYKKCIEFR